MNSTRLVELCKAQLGWSKATTYTVIRRLGERGVLKNENATVAQTVAEKFTKLPTRDKAYFVGYLMGKEAERNSEEDNKSA